jgi:hypothetical protein
MVDLSIEDIRVNVFLPDVREDKVEGIWELSIPPKMHLGMDTPDDAPSHVRIKREAERNIRFKPSQGATGVVYLNGESESALKTEQPHDWPARYDLTDSQRDVIHESLEWVLSLPLPIGDAREVLGVLNVDGLRLRPAKEDLEGLLGRIAPRVLAVAGLLRKFPQAEIRLQILGGAQ